VFLYFTAFRLKTNAATQSFCHLVGVTSVTPADGDVTGINSILAFMLCVNQFGQWKINTIVFSHFGKQTCPVQFCIFDSKDTD